MNNQFKNYFEQLSGFPPLRWQQRLFNRFIENELPDSLDLPTGMGKTSVMLLWLLARALNPKLPKRLIYVVDRRVVVDQASEVAEKIRSILNELSELKAQLGLDEPEDLAISTLRGQFLDNRKWLADPTKPAIIIGTIDMIGSRLLFEGYGVSRNMRRYHAGFLGADSLFILDEAHLCLPFEAMLQEIVTNTALHPKVSDKSLIPPAKCLSLSATGKQNGKQPFGLEEEDYEDTVVVKRLNAEKQLTLEIKNDTDSLSKLLSECAWQLKDSGQRILIFCTKREDAKKIKDDLDKRMKQDKVTYPVNLLTGGRRVQERQDLSEWLKTYGFLAGASTSLETPAFLIATSAGEVGIDLDADHMVCDLVAYERMVQRFGRVNRRGEKQAVITVIMQPPISKPTSPENSADKKQQQAYLKSKKNYEQYLQDWASFRKSGETDSKNNFRQAYRIYQAQKRILQLLGTDASPKAIVALKKNARTNKRTGILLEHALSEEPLRPALTRALVDAWSMTSLEQHTARPAIEPWLRGWLPNKEPETSLVWREYLPWRENDASPNTTEVEAFFEHAPIHLSETLEVPVYQAVGTLLKRLKQVFKGQELPEKPVLLVLNQSGKLVKDGALTARQLVDKETKDLQNLFAYQQVVIDRRLGGLSSAGLLDGHADGAELVTLDHQWSPDSLRETVGYRIQCVEKDVSVEAGWHTVHRFNPSSDEQEEPTKVWLIQVYRGKKSPQQGDPAITSFNQSLNAHLHWAGQEMAKIAAQLALPGEYNRMLVISSEGHDLGKSRLLWQTAMNAPQTGRPYAKTKGGGNPKSLGGYRHEFGSLVDVADNEELNALPTELYDLALHLIASHHGYACPVIAPIDPDAPPSILAERAQQTALRFARLQRQWGPWGLAWWEAVFRAADHRASQISDELTETEDKA